jgi:hypothetical protein
VEGGLAIEINNVKSASVYEGNIRSAKTKAFDRVLTFAHVTVMRLAR